MDDLPGDLGDDLRQHEEEECQGGGGDGRRDPQVVAERFAEGRGCHSGQQDAAGEAEQAEELADESAEGAPHGEGHEQRHAEDVEGHPGSRLAAISSAAAGYGGYRIVMSFLISLPASSRLDL